MKNNKTIITLILGLCFCSNYSFSQFSPYEVTVGGFFDLPPNGEYKCSDSLILTGVVLFPLKVEGIRKPWHYDVNVFVPLKFYWEIGSKMYVKIPGNPRVSNTHPKYDLSLFLKLKIVYSIQGMPIAESIEELLNVKNGVPKEFTPQLITSKDFYPQTLKNIDPKDGSSHIRVHTVEILEMEYGVDGMRQHCPFYKEQVDKLNSKAYIDSLLLLGGEFFANEDYYEAKKYYEKLHKMLPDDKFVQMRLEKVDKYLAEEEKEIEYKKFFDKGKELTEAGKFAEAKEYFEKALEQKPVDPDASAAIARVEQLIEKQEKEKTALENEKQNTTTNNVEGELQESNDNKEIDTQNAGTKTVDEYSHSYKQTEESIKRERERQQLIKLETINREYEEKRQKDAEIIYSLGQNLSNYIGSIAEGNRKEQAFNKIVDEHTSFSGYSYDPSSLISEYKTKIENINKAFADREVEVMNDIQRGINAQVNMRNQGATAAEQNMNQASGELAGMIATMSAQNRIEKEKREAKEKLEEELKEEMTKLKDNLISKNTIAAENHLNNTIKAVNKNDEEYYYRMYNYHNCCRKSIEEKFYYKGTSWVEPNCTKPTRQYDYGSSSIKKDVLYLDAAKRKLELYHITKEDGFLKSAKEMLNTALYYNNKNAEAYFIRSTITDYIIDKLIDIITAIDLEPENTTYKKEYEKIKEDYINEFYSSVRQDETPFISRSIKASLFVNEKDYNNLNPVEVSVKYDNGETFRILYSSEFYYNNFIFKNEKYILEYIVKNDADGCLEKLLDLDSTLIINYPEQTTLYLASSQKSNSVVRSLISKNIGVEETMNLPEVKEDEELTKYISKNIFSVAIKNDNIKMAKLSLNYYPEVYLDGDKPNCDFLCEIVSENRTNLFYLIKKMQTDIVISNANSSGTFINQTRKRTDLLINAINNNKPEILKNLIDIGIDINYKDEKGNTPLHSAIIDLKYSCAKILINANPDLNTINLDGWAPIHLSIWKGSYIITEQIIKKGADINIKGPYGWTPLHFAVRENNSRVVNLLLDNGANTSLKDNNGITPLKLAKRSRYSEIVVLLSKK